MFSLAEYIDSQYSGSLWTRIERSMLLGPLSAPANASLMSFAHFGPGSIVIVARVMGRLRDRYPRAAELPLPTGVGVLGAHALSSRWTWTIRSQVQVGCARYATSVHLIHAGRHRGARALHTVWGRARAVVSGVAAVLHPRAP
jgi:hypothetical protein